MKKEIFIFLFFLFLSLILAELILRALMPSSYTYDKKYGWARSKPDILKLTIPDRANATSNVTVTYYQFGFKRFGNITSNRTKMFIVGDSFTEMAFISNGEEWYSYIEKEFNNTELFVYGTGGFGSLQEYIVLDDYIDKIKPDIILWQFYFNDFINNDYQSDLGEYPLGNFAYRPYLENGEIVYRLPLPMSFFREHSKIIDLSLKIYDQFEKRKMENDKRLFFAKIYGENYWNRNFEDSLIFKGSFDRVLKTTSDVFLLARKRAGKTPIYLFSADSRLEKAEKYITSQSNITYISGVSQYIQDMKDDGYRPFVVNDGHWNFEGNRLVGEFLADYFRKEQILKS